MCCMVARGSDGSLVRTRRPGGRENEGDCKARRDTPQCTSVAVIAGVQSVSVIDPGRWRYSLIRWAFDESGSPVRRRIVSTTAASRRSLACSASAVVSLVGKRSE